MKMCGTTEADDGDVDGRDHVDLEKYRSCITQHDPRVLPLSTSYLSLPCPTFSFIYSLHQ